MDQTAQNRILSYGAQAAAAVIIAAMLIVISSYNYLLFHGIVELSAIAVSLAIFLLVWNTRRMITDSFLLLLGISFLFIGGIDLLHTLAYKGMGVFPGNSADLPTQLWLAARYFQSIMFLAASLLIGRSLTKDRTWDIPVYAACCTAFAGILLASIFAWQNFPAAFVEGSGLTAFKITSEYLISFILIATIGVLVYRRQYLDPAVWSNLVAAQIFLVVAELSFTSYASVYGPMNMLGHLFRFASVYCFYRAIVVAGLTRPHDLLYRELKQNETALARRERQYRALVELSPDAIFVYRDQRIEFVNASALQLFGADRPEQVIGRSPLEIFHPDYHPQIEERIRQLRSGSPVLRADEQVVQLDGSVRDVEIAAFPFEDAGGPAIEVILHDITDRKEAQRGLVRKNEELGQLNEELSQLNEELRSAHEELFYTQEELRQNLEELTHRETRLNEMLEEKEILLAEIHHRVKNNLTAFISLLSLDGSYEDSETGRALKKDLQNRARSMALIHETLYETRKFSHVDMDIYLSRLLPQITGSYAGTRDVRTLIQATGVFLDLPRATTAGLIINELVTNSYKYAFPPGFDCRVARGAPCTIRVRLTRDEESCVLTVCDNGQGLPPDLDPLATRSLGLKLVAFLARHQLRADLEVKKDAGTVFIFRLKPLDKGE